MIVKYLKTNVPATMKAVQYQPIVMILVDVNDEDDDDQMGSYTVVKLLDS